MFSIRLEPTQEWSASMVLYMGELRPYQQTLDKVGKARSTLGYAPSFTCQNFDKAGLLGTNTPA